MAKGKATKTATRYIPCDPVSIASFIEETRGSLTLNQVAEVLGVTRSVIHLWKNGTHLPRPKVLEALGLRPCLEVTNDEPFAQSTREQMLEKEVRSLRKQLRAQAMETAKTPARVKPAKGK